MTVARGGAIEFTLRAENDEPVLRLKNVTKRFGAVHALEGISCDIYAGEIVGLVGDNGAGKSTALKIIAGAETPSSGEVVLKGEPVHFRSPAEARKRGIEAVYQDLALVELFDVASNLFLGQEPTLRPWLPIMRLRDMRIKASNAIRDLHVNIPNTNSIVRRMSGGQRQAVAVARGVFWNAQLFLLDEPTAALGAEESRQVMLQIRKLADAGAAVLLISHNLDHVWALCDRIIVLRRGKHVASLVKGDTTPEQVVAWITGLNVVTASGS